MKRVLIVLMIVSLLFTLLAFASCGKKNKSNGSGLSVKDELQEEDTDDFDFNSLD